MRIALAAGGLAFAAAPDGRAHQLAQLTGGEISDTAFARLTAQMDPAMLTLAGRMVTGTSSTDLMDGADAPVEGQLKAEAVALTAEPDVLRLQDLTPDEARAWNIANPTSTAPNPAARPFMLKTTGMLDEARAVDCLTAAIYYEAAWESVDGQRAVAQVVLNRMRHPAFPKTVCGVVFQGSNRKTGCQFSFTCDGAMARTPQDAVWSRARSVAEQALNGYVMRKVGNATHYHANYVAAYWSPNMVKVGTIGAHIFYRWTGGWGLPPAFSGRYEGNEAQGMQIAALDRVATGPDMALVSAKDPTVLALPAEDVVKPGTATGKAEGTESVPANTLVTVADATKPGETLVKAEDLDWAGRPRQKGPPRLASPGV